MTCLLGRVPSLQLHLPNADHSIAKPVLLYSSEFQLETMKNGQIIASLDLSSKGSFKFGRMPECDVTLEHPSASRLHAVIQFKAQSGLPFLYDAASVHGTFVNKRKIAAKTYVPLK